MANPARLARAAVLATWPQAEVVERYGNGIKHLLTPNRYGLDLMVGQGPDPNLGPMHHRSGGYWRENDTAHILDGADGFAVKTGNLPFHIRMAENGRRRIYPILGDFTRYIEISPQNFALPAPTLKGEDFFYWNLPNLAVTLQTTTALVKLSAILKNANAPKVYKFNVSLFGLTRQGANIKLGSEVVATIRTPTARTTLTHKEVPVTWGISAGVLTITVNTSGVTWAIDGQVDLDPTLDLQVGAGANDGRRYTGTNGFSAVSTYIYLGYSNDANRLSMNGFLRWTGVTISGTITTSYIQVYASADTAGAPTLKVYGVDENNPAAPTSAEEFDADPLTTAGVDWDGVWTGDDWNSSPSLNAIFQELVDSYIINDAAVMVQIKNDGGVVEQHNEMHMYEDNTTLAAKLYIEYVGTPASLDCVVATASVFSPNTSIGGKALLAAVLASATGSSPVAFLFGKGLLAAGVVACTVRAWAATLTGSATYLNRLFLRGLRQ